MKKGFTLIEVAIVMVIIGLLVGGSIQMMNVLNQRAKITEAKQQLETLNEAIKGFVQNNGSLPTQAQFSTLGNIIDPWGKQIDYYNIDDSNNSICTYTASFSTNGTPIITNVAFSIVSSGENRNMQTDLLNELTLYIQGSTNGPNIDDNTTDFNRPEPYDDLYKIVSLNELKTFANCNINQLQIINPTLPVGNANNPYSVQLVATINGTECSAPTDCTYSIVSIPNLFNITASGLLQDSDNNATVGATVQVTAHHITTNSDVNRTYVITINP